VDYLIIRIHLTEYITYSLWRSFISF